MDEEFTDASLGRSTDFFDTDEGCNELLVHLGGTSLGFFAGVWQSNDHLYVFIWNLSSLKTNIASESRPSQKESSLPPTFFQKLCYKGFRSVESM